jgi:hypothetical protein
MSECSIWPCASVGVSEWEGGAGADVSETGVGIHARARGRSEGV